MAPIANNSNNLNNKLWETWENVKTQKSNLVRWTGGLTDRQGRNLFAFYLACVSWIYSMKNQIRANNIANYILLTNHTREMYLQKFSRRIKPRPALSVRKSANTDLSSFRKLLQFTKNIRRTCKISIIWNGN